MNTVTTDSVLGIFVSSPLVLLVPNNELRQGFIYCVTVRGSALHHILKWTHIPSSGLRIHSIAPERFKPEDRLIFVEISQGTRIFFTVFFITALSRERRDRTRHRETPSGWAMPEFIT